MIQNGGSPKFGTENDVVNFPSPLCMSKKINSASVKVVTAALELISNKYMPI